MRALEFYFDENSIYPPARNSGGTAITDGSGSNLSYMVSIDLTAFIMAPISDPRAPTYSYQYVRGTARDTYGIYLYSEQVGAYCKTGVKVEMGWWGTGVPICD